MIMRFKLMMFLSVCLFSAQWAKIQNYYEHYQDGLIDFQLKLDAKMILCKAQWVECENYPLFPTILSAYDIVEVKQPHRDLDAELVYSTYQIRIRHLNTIHDLVNKLGTHSTIES